MKFAADLQLASKLNPLNNVLAFALLLLMSASMIFSMNASTVRAAETGYSVGNIATDFTATDTDGKVFHLAELKGKKPVYLIFWATWCKTCKQEIPTFINLYQQHHTDLEIVSINVDSLSFWSSLKKSNSRVKEYIKEYNLPYRVILDDDETLIKQFHVQGTPTQLLIDKEGLIRKRYPLFTEKTEHLIEKIIAED